jgi:hypothetical protein
MGNEIVLRSVYGKVNQIYFIQPCPNPKTGKLPDCVKTVNSLGDMVLSEEDVKQMSEGNKHFVPANKVFEIVDGIVFDLDDVVDKANWEAIQFCNWIAKDRYQRDENGNLIIDGGEKRYGVADLYVDRPGEVAKARVSKKQLIHRASDYIYEDTDANRIKKAKVLGRDLKTAIPADVLDYLIEQAEKDPHRILKLYEDEDWKLQLFILDAIDKRVIKKSDGIYKYDDKMLGGSMDATVTFLKDVKYKKLIDSMRKETYPELLPKAELDDLEREMIENITQDNTPPNKGKTK